MTLKQILRSVNPEPHFRVRKFSLLNLSVHMEIKVCVCLVYILIINKLLGNKSIKNLIEIWAQIKLSCLALKFLRFLSQKKNCISQWSKTSFFKREKKRKNGKMLWRQTEREKEKRNINVAAKILAKEKQLLIERKRGIYFCYQFLFNFLLLTLNQF